MDVLSAYLLIGIKSFTNKLLETHTHDVAKLTESIDDVSGACC